MAKRTRVYTKLNQMKRDAARDGFEFMQRLDGTRNYLFENLETGMRRVYTPYGLEREYMPKSLVCGDFHRPLELHRPPRLVSESWKDGFGTSRTGEQN